MQGLFKKAALATALTAITGAAVTATPAQAHGGDAAGAAIVGGIIGLGVGAAIASDHDRYYRGPYYGGPVGYYAPAPVASQCYVDAYGGCYPVNYYYDAGWAWRDGGWWYGGARYARPYYYGHGGGYGYHGGYGYRGGGYGGGYHGGGYGGYRGGGEGGHGGWGGHR